MNVASVLSWLAAWTLLGGAVLLLTKWLNRRAGCAAVRHLAWVGAFLSVSLSSVWLITLSLARGRSVETGTCVPGATRGNILLSGLFGAWAIGLGWVLIRVVLARVVTCRWRKTSRPYDHAQETNDWRKIDVRIAQEDYPVVPITWGVFRPVVLLPRVADDWHHERLSAVLNHELGHIRRFDNLTQRWVLFLCAIHWFNPLFWVAARQMEAEAEIAADDFAILRGMKPSSYATELLGVASEQLSKGWRCPLTQTAMVKKFSLEERLRSIIDPDAERGVVSLRSRAKAVAACAGVTSLLLVSIPRFANLLKPSVGTPPDCLTTETSASAKNGI